jgi:hypothetical protein
LPFYYKWKHIRKGSPNLWKPQILLQTLWKIKAEFRKLRCISHYTWPGNIKPYTSTQNVSSRSSLIRIPVASATEHTLAATFHPLPLFPSFSETSLDVAGILLCYHLVLRSLYSSYCSTLDLYFALVLQLGGIIPTSASLH